jgi:hypothetical protein
MEQYISKDALVREIEKRIEETKGMQPQFDQFWAGQISAFKGVLKILDTLEVKEVDYERELSKYVSNGIHRFFPNVDDDYCKMDSVIWQDYVIETAKHFYELGLKEQLKNK